MEQIPDGIGQSLIAQARKALRYSYSPYSKCAVGAAIYTDTKEIFTGCNIENVSFGATVCAERVAIQTAISQGAKKILAVAITTNLPKPISPCGLCCQVLSEFSTGETPIFMDCLAGATEEANFSDLFTLKLIPGQIFAAQKKQGEE